MILRSNISTN